MVVKNVPALWWEEGETMTMGFTASVAERLEAILNELEGSPDLRPEKILVVDYLEWKEGGEA